MSSISTLSSENLATHAFNIFLTQGRHIEGARIIYHALKLHPQNPVALRCLSDFHAKEGTEQFSAVTLEYALSEACGIQGPYRQVLDDLRFLSIWSWGFSKHKSGSTNLDGAAFQTRDDFVFDATGYKSFVDGVVGRCGTLESACNASHCLTGVMAGFLRHISKPNPAIDEVIDPTQFIETDAYIQWLQSSADHLIELDRSVQARRKQ
jgi:hypothetical protein